MSKVCSVCCKQKPVTEFVNLVTGFETKMCANCRAIRTRSKNKNWKTRQEYNRKTLYGMSSDEYTSLLEIQNGSCAICNKLPDTHATYKVLAVDHDHASKRVRGLLCSQCNVGLGMFQHNPKLLLKALEYLGFRDPIDM